MKTSKLFVVMFAFCGLIAGALRVAAAAEEAPAAAPRHNVLFIAIDDLRPQLNCYGEKYMVTPHLDKLAAGGRRFERHYVQAPTCGASRYALMTGLRPSTPRSMDNGAFADLAEPTPERPESMAHLFRRHGYRTVCLGKISHQPDGRVFSYDGRGDGHLELPHSWDEVGAAPGKWETAWNAFFGYADGSARVPGKTPAFEAADVEDEGYPDGLLAGAAVEKLRELKDKPFFLAVGFYKPHLPFNAPRKYWDLYDRDEIPLSPNPEAPAHIDIKRSLHGSGEMFGSYRHPERGGAGKRISDDYARTLRHAYFAAVSYADAQAGKLLDELELQMQAPRLPDEVAEEKTGEENGP